MIKKEKEEKGSVMNIDEDEGKQFSEKVAEIDNNVNRNVMNIYYTQNTDYFFRGEIRDEENKPERKYCNKTIMSDIYQESVPFQETNHLP